MDDKQIAVCHRGEPLKVIDLRNKNINVNIQQIDMDLDMLDRGGFPHFMLKEIFDQPHCLRDCMRGRLFDDEVVLSAVRNNSDRLLSATRFIIVACGTSWHAGLVGKQLIEHFCKIPVEVDYASEFRYRDRSSYPLMSLLPSHRVVRLPTPSPLSRWLRRRVLISSVLSTPWAPV